MKQTPRRRRRPGRPALSIEPALPFLPGPYVPVTPPRTVWQIGTGGTGSQLVQWLARTLYQFRQRAPERAFRLILFDGDVVTAANVGRQNFAPADVGYSKAELLAARYNGHFGTTIEAVPAFFTPELGRQVCQEAAPPLRPDLIVSAVDNNAARRQVAAFIKTARIPLLWADVGNGRYHGQMVIGNTLDRQQLEASLHVFRRKHHRVLRHLPAAPLVHPEISDPGQDSPAVAPGGCAQALLDDEQSLPVNSLAGLVTFQAVYALLTGQPLHYFAAYFHSMNNTVHTRNNTASNFCRVLQALPSQPAASRSDAA